jgi:hypothetical protein
MGLPQRGAELRFVDGPEIVCSTLAEGPCRQRFAREDVEALANDIGLDLQRAARGVDQVYIGQWKWADQPSMH